MASAPAAQARPGSRHREPAHHGALIDFLNDPHTLARIREAAICCRLRATVYLSVSGRDLDLEFMITALTVPYFGGHLAISAVGDPEHKIVPRRIETYCPYQGDTPGRIPSGGWGIGNCQPFAIKRVRVSSTLADVGPIDQIRGDLYAIVSRFSLT